MVKDRRKIEKKRKKEAAKSKRVIAYCAAKKRESQRPKVMVDPTGGDPVLVRRIGEAAKSVSLEESRGCPPEIAELVARFMRDGPEETTRYLRTKAALDYDHHQDVVNYEQQRLRSVIAYVGERVFEQLPETYRAALLPSHYFYPLFVPAGVEIQFGFLKRVRRDTGWGYYSPSEPTVEINGTKWIVCFSEHAIARIVERSSFEDPVTYSHYMDCAAYLHGCVHYEPVTMADGRPAIRLFMTEDLGGPTERYREYLRKIAGIEDVYKYPVIPAYVLGYCHIDCKGKFAKAISCWYPGYNGTPEDLLVRSSTIPRDERQRLLAMAGDNKTIRVINEGRHEAIKWYHDNGVPQVVFPQRRLFEWEPYDYRSDS